MFRRPRSPRAPRAGPDGVAEPVGPERAPPACCSSPRRRSPGSPVSPTCFAAPSRNPANSRRVTPKSPSGVGSVSSTPASSSAAPTWTASTTRPTSTPLLGRALAEAVRDRVGVKARPLKKNRAGPNDPATSTQAEVWGGRGAATRPTAPPSAGASALETAWHPQAGANDRPRLRGSKTFQSNNDTSSDQIINNESRIARDNLVHFNKVLKSVLADIFLYIKRRSCYKLFQENAETEKQARSYPASVSYTCEHDA